MQQQQQRSPSLNAIEMFPPLEARTLVANMSSVHKAVQRENMRLHEGNLDVQSGGRWDVPGCHTARHSEGEIESEGEREQEERVSWTSKRPSINDLKQARLVHDLTPLVENKAQSAISSPVAAYSVSGAQHAQEHDPVETPVSSLSSTRSTPDLGSFLLLSPTVDQDVSRKCCTLDNINIVQHALPRTALAESQDTLEQRKNTPPPRCPSLV
jgi:hypothetical protein